MAETFAPICTDCGRESIRAEQLLLALILQSFYRFGRGRLPCEQLGFNNRLMQHEDARAVLCGYWIRPRFRYAGYLRA